MQAAINYKIIKTRACPTSLRFGVATYRARYRSASSLQSFTAFTSFRCGGCLRHPSYRSRIYKKKGTDLVFNQYIFLSFGKRGIPLKKKSKINCQNSRLVQTKLPLVWRLFARARDRPCPFLPICLTAI